VTTDRPAIMDPDCSARTRSAKRVREVRVINGNRDGGRAHGPSPTTPPDKRVRIRRFDELVRCRTAQRLEVQKNAPPMVVSPLDVKRTCTSKLSIMHGVRRIQADPTRISPLARC